MGLKARDPKYTQRVQGGQFEGRSARIIESPGSLVVRRQTQHGTKMDTDPLLRVEGLGYLVGCSDYPCLMNSYTSHP